MQFNMFKPLFVRFWTTFITQQCPQVRKNMWWRLRALFFLLSFLVFRLILIFLKSFIKVCPIFRRFLFENKFLSFSHKPMKVNYLTAFTPASLLNSKSWTMSRIRNNYNELRFNSEDGTYSIVSTLFQGLQPEEHR